MDTESVIDVVVSDAPPPRWTVDDIVGLGQRNRRRHQARWMAVAGCSLAALAVAATLVVPRLLDELNARSAHPARPAAGAAPAPVPSRSPSAAPAAPEIATSTPFVFTMRGYTRGGFRVDKPRIVSTAYQAAAVFRDDIRVGYLTVFRPGAFDQGAVAGRPPTTISGRPAAEWSQRKEPEGTTERYLAWQYADRAWVQLEAATSDPDFVVATDLRNIAAGLIFGEAIPAKLPFTLSHVPSGYRPLEVGMNAWTGKNGLAVIEQDNPAGALFARPAPRPAGLTDIWDNYSPIDIPDNFTIAVQLDTPKARPTGVRCDDEAGFCVQWRDGGRVKLYVESAGRLSNKEMTKTLNGIRLASIGDESTWTEALKAIPARP